MQINDEVKRNKIQNTWIAMMARCYKPNHPAYKWYGERGIEVCERWRDTGRVKRNRGLGSTLGFLNFLEDLSETWFFGEGMEAASLDRIDKDGHYDFDNCRWVTRSQNVSDMLVERHKETVAARTHNFLKPGFQSRSARQSLEKGTHPFQNLEMKTCPYCQRNLNIANYNRWHGINCKERKI